AGRGAALPGQGGARARSAQGGTDLNFSRFDVDQCHGAGAEAEWSSVGILTPREGSLPTGFPRAQCSVVAALLRRWRIRIGAGLRRLEEPQRADAASPLGRGEDPTPLLTRRMLALGLTPEDVWQDEPAMFAELRARCGRCEAQGQCAFALLHGAADPAWQEWRIYGHNGPKLRMLSVLNVCRPGGGEWPRPAVAAAAPEAAMMR